MATAPFLVALLQQNCGQILPGSGVRAERFWCNEHGSPWLGLVPCLRFRSSLCLVVVAAVAVVVAVAVVAVVFVLLGNVQLFAV